MFGSFSNPPRKSTSYLCNLHLLVPLSLFPSPEKGDYRAASQMSSVFSHSWTRLVEEPLGPVLVKNCPWLFLLSFSFSWSNSTGFQELGLELLVSHVFNFIL